VTADAASAKRSRFTSGGDTCARSRIPFAAVESLSPPGQTEAILDYMKEFYIGNSSSQIVHLPDCGYASQIHPDNFEVYEHLHQALSQEYYECRWCLGGARELEYKVKVNKGIIREYKGVECVACGEARGIQDAHIVPRREGGTDTMPLCPTCHWNYDHNMLDEEESNNIEEYLGVVVER